MEMKEYKKRKIKVSAYVTDKEFLIKSKGKELLASVGDYIITSKDGERHPCKPDIFKKTYDKGENEGEYYKKQIVIKAYKAEKEEIIHTLEGDVKANVGDYVVTGVAGEQYPIPNDKFLEIYEEYNEKKLDDLINSFKNEKTEFKNNSKDNYVR